MKQQEEAFDNKTKEERIFSFQQMNLNGNLQLALADFGYSSPTDSQRRLIQAAQQRKDVLFVASAGTGKTLGAIIALLHIIGPNSLKCQAIFLCPCREVARHTLKPVIELTQHSQYGVRLFMGGSSPRQDRQSLRRENITIALGTPGRMLDMINRRAMDVEEVKIVVLDEADQMLSRGFYDQLKQMFQLLPPQVTVVVATATLYGLQQIIEKLLRSPVEILQAR